MAAEDSVVPAGPALSAELLSADPLQAGLTVPAPVINDPTDGLCRGAAEDWRFDASDRGSR